MRIGDALEQAGCLEHICNIMIFIREKHAKLFFTSLELLGIVQLFEIR
jgi:hypothetical protein